MNKLRVSVKDKADRGVGPPTVSDDSSGLIFGSTESGKDVQDSCSLIVEGLRRPLRVVPPIETRKCHRNCTGVVGFQVFKDFIPRPGAQPVAGDEDDVRTACSCCHITTLAGAKDKCVSLFMS